ncbi:MAG: zf-HC2 domain-containing protein [Clostridia bacterium]|nr:zf-HC2 domain-containing protein [Clostridia bacterium]
MKRNDCSIVQDLLPLYIEEMLQPDTVAYVEDHLSGCETCTDLLAELKSADPPAPDAEDARTGDQRVLKGLKKFLRLQHFIIVLAFSYFFLFFIPWTNYKWAGPGLSGAAFTGFPVLMAAVLACRRDEISRNMALVATGIVLPTALFPLFFFMTHYGQTLHFSSGDQLDYVIRPLFWLALSCGLLLTAIALHNIRHKVIPLPADRNPRQKFILSSALLVAALIILLSLFPIVSPENYSNGTLVYVNLIWGWPLIYLTIAIAFCQVTCKNEATRATVFALFLPAYAALPFLTQSAYPFTTIYTVEKSALFVPVYHIPHLIASLLLSATAICSVWYQLKQQTKHAPPAA